MTKTNNKTTNLAVVALFAAVCGVVLYQKLSKPSVETPTAPAATSQQPDKPRAQPKPALEVLFASSDGKKEWINDVVKAFNEQHLEVDGQVVVVKAEHMRSGESRQAILSGKSKPTIWGPAGKSWVDLINQDFQTREHHPFLPETSDTVNTALVIAMWEPMAQALGYPKKEIGWKELHQVVVNPKGWAAYGHPEWGSFKFGHSHPDYSNSAMLSVVSMMYAGANKTAGITSADMKSPAVTHLVRDIEQSVVHYGESSSWLVDKLCQRGPGYLSAVTIYESSVVKMNDKCTGKPFKLVAVYPKEGTFWETHPAGVVEAEWVTAAQREGAKAFLAFLVSASQQAKAAKYGFRPALKTAPLTAPFDEAHGVAPDAIRRELEYVSEDQYQEANGIWHETKKKAAVWVLLDTSASMRGQAMNSAKAGTVNFLKKMERDDFVEVIAFNNTVVPLGPGGKMRDVGEGLTQQVEGLYADGQTSLFDVLTQALGEIAEARKHDREKRSYAIVVLSDGQDTSSRGNRAGVLEKLPKAEDTDGTRIFTIAYGNEADEDFLRTISERSNAVNVKGSSSDIDKLYHQISAYF